jgi:hypothetical protein
MSNLDIEIHNKRVDCEDVESFIVGYEEHTGRKISFLDAAIMILGIKDYGQEVTK